MTISVQASAYAEGRKAAFEEAAELLRLRASNLTTGKKRINQVDLHVSQVLNRAADDIAAKAVSLPSDL